MQKKLNIGISCYPTYGGSGIIATEIGLEMARRGHRVHFITADFPKRFDRFQQNVFFHSVEAHDYPLLAFPHYDLALASKMVEVSTYEKLDLFHVHYAVPHATSAYLARQILADKAPKTITTLHGTDITLVGNERSYLAVAKFSIMESNGVTAPSNFLKNATYDKLNIPSSFPINVIPNFVDTERFKPLDRKDSHTACKDFPEKPILSHISNFREAKKVEDVVKVFSIVKKELDSHLLLVGDGPSRSKVEALVHELGLSDSVCFLGKQEAVEEIIQRSDLFILPSRNESFGLAAIEAMSCGVPVICSNAEGLPEVICHAENGFLSDVGDVEDMASNCLILLKDSSLREQFSKNARARVLELYPVKNIIDIYENFYYQILNRS
jgi:N-acetyl-alpha-D-glucosaminyl L-malate synthase BshA